jgi:HEAT repeat protein
MSNLRVSSPARILFAMAIACLCTASPSHAYIDLAPTLAKVITDSRRIAVVEVVELDRAKHELTLKEVRSLKGAASADPIRHDVATAEGAAIPRNILQWAAPGARGVMFASRATTLVCLGQGWYQVRSTGSGLWKLGTDRPDLPLAYYGSATALVSSIEQMLAGKTVVVTMVAHGGDNEGASLDLALNRPNLPGLVRVQRIHANMKMPSLVFATVSNPAYFVGVGPVDEGDVPSLIEKLKSPDAPVRADAAADLRSVGRKARPAEEHLTPLLNDASAQVRLSAAAALLQVNPGNASALDELKKGLESTDWVVRRDAVRETGLAGAGAAPLAEKLGRLLKDADEPMRITVLQAITVLGPAAAKATDAVVPLLDNKDLTIDAADALGRIGPAASPALKPLAKLLSSDQSPVRWAAVRAMAQIGGPDAHPAVDFMVQALKSANETEGYNMVIYLAMLGPVAADASQALRSAPLKNPMLPPAAQWAMAPEKGFPWQSGGMFNGTGNAGMFDDIIKLFYQDYVHEMGDRLRPLACMLARQIMDGTAGDVPAWGYDLLACGGEEAAAILAPHLSSSDTVKRERAAVALGYMGPAAAPARSQLAAAQSNAPTDREKALIDWSLWRIDAQ